MTKPMNEYGSADLWIMGRQRAEAESLNRTPEAFCDLIEQDEIDRLENSDLGRNPRYQPGWYVFPVFAFGVVVIVGAIAALVFG